MNVLMKTNPLQVLFWIRQHEDVNNMVSGTLQKHSSKPVEGSVTNSNLHIEHVWAVQRQSTTAQEPVSSEFALKRTHRHVGGITVEGTNRYNTEWVITCCNKCASCLLPAFLGDLHSGLLM